MMRLGVFSDRGGNVTDAKPVTSNGEGGELAPLSREILVSGPRRKIGQRNAGHRFHSSHELATSYPAVNVIDGSRNEEARMSPHGIPPMRGRNPTNLHNHPHSATM